jgi:hypothetical protein
MQTVFGRRFQSEPKFVIAFAARTLRTTSYSNT